MEVFVSLKPTPAELANEVQMSAVDKLGIFLIVEGDADSRLLTRIFDLKNHVVLPAFGWEAVVEVLRLLEKVKPINIIGLIDRDYHDIPSVKNFAPNIIKTDHRDLDVTLFISTAVDVFLREFGSGQKIVKAGGIEAIKSKIFSECRKIGYWRILSSYKTNNNLPPLSFKGLSHSRFIDKRSLEFDPNSFLAHIRGLSRHNISYTLNDIEIFINSNPHIRELPNNRICRGHDLFELCAISLMFFAGNHSANEWDGDAIERVCRISIDKNEIRKMSFAQALITHFSCSGYQI